MSSTIALDPSTWDLTLDADNNIAVLDDPNSLAQDAASACRTFLGECYWDTTIGVPYLEQILAKSPSLPLLKAEFVSQALTVPNVASAKCFIASLDNRSVSGQLQIISDNGQSSAINFTTINPQGG